MEHNPFCYSVCYIYTCFKSFLKDKWENACTINLFSICGSFVWTIQLFPRQSHLSSFYHIYLYLIKLCTFQLHVHWLHILICMILPLVYLTCSWERKYILIHSWDMQWQGPEIRKREAPHPNPYTPLFIVWTPKSLHIEFCHPRFFTYTKGNAKILTGVVTLRKVNNLLIKHDLKSTKFLYYQIIPRSSLI